MLVREIVILFCYCYSEVVLWDPPFPLWKYATLPSTYMLTWSLLWPNFIVIIIYITWLIAWSIYIWKEMWKLFRVLFLSSFCTLINCYIIIIFSRSWKNSSCIWWSECLLGSWYSNQSLKQSFLKQVQVSTKLANWGIYHNKKEI